MEIPIKIHDLGVPLLEKQRIRGGFTGEESHSTIEAVYDTILHLPGHSRPQHPITLDSH